MEVKNVQRAPCFFWGPRVLRDSYRLLAQYQTLREMDVFYDVTLLVGPSEVPIKGHRIILAITFDYFKSMFTSGLLESSQNEVSLTMC